MITLKQINSLMENKTFFILSTDTTKHTFNCFVPIYFENSAHLGLVMVRNNKIIQISSFHSAPEHINLSGFTKFIDTNEPIASDIKTVVANVILRNKKYFIYSIEQNRIKKSFIFYKRINFF